MLYKERKKSHIVLHVLGVVAYVLYVSMSDIYPLLPPLVGVLFLIFHRHYNDKNIYIPILVILCVFYYEFDKSLVVGIMPCVFFIVHLFIASRLESFLTLNIFFLVFYVASCYMLYIAGMLLCNIIFKTPVLDFSSVYMYYAIVDAAFMLLYYFIFIKE